MTHPNTLAAGSAGAIGILTVWALNSAGVDTPPEVAAAIPVATITAALFIGRRGLKGIARIVWKGDPTL